MLIQLELSRFEASDKGEAFCFSAAMYGIAAMYGERDDEELGYVSLVGHIDSDSDHISPLFLSSSSDHCLVEMGKAKHLDRISENMVSYWVKKVSGSIFALPPKYAEECKRYDERFPIEAPSVELKTVTAKGEHIVNAKALVSISDFDLSSPKFVDQLQKELKFKVPNLAEIMSYALMDLLNRAKGKLLKSEKPEYLSPSNLDYWSREAAKAFTSGGVSRGSTEVRRDSITESFDDVEFGPVTMSKPRIKVEVKMKDEELGDLLNESRLLNESSWGAF